MQESDLDKANREAELAWSEAQTAFRLAKEEYRRKLQEIETALAARAGIHLGQPCWYRNDPKRKYIVTALGIVLNFNTYAIGGVQVRVRLISRSGRPSKRWDKMESLFFDLDGKYRNANHDTECPFEFEQTEAVKE